jgi:general secretion pathway protein D
LVAFAITASLCLAGQKPATSPSAASLFRGGQQAEKAGDPLKAYLLYSEAARKKPKNPQYAERRDRLRSSAALAAKPEMQLSEPDSGDTSPLRTNLPAMELSLAERIEADRALPPPTLAGLPGKRSFDLRADARTLWETVLATYGIVPMFEVDYYSPPVRFRVNNVDFHEAFRALELVSDSFLVPVDQRTAVISRDTPAKRAAMTPMVSLGAPIPERISVQEAQETLTAVQQTLEMRRITMDAGKRMVYFRDTAAKAEAARQMFQSLSRSRAQVEIGIQILAYGKTSALNYGLTLPDSTAVVDFSRTAGPLANNVAPASGFKNYVGVGGGSSFLGVGVTDSAAFETLTASSAESLLESQVVSLDGQAASLHIGNRYPILSGNLTSATGSATGLGAFSQVRFEDLGLVVKVTPTVHADGEITLDLETDFKTIAPGGANGIPAISQRHYQGKVRLRNGEWAVVAGLLTTEDATTPKGIVGLSQIPLIGRFFRKNQRQRSESDTLVVLRPRLTTLPPWEQPTRTVFLGSEGKPLLRY